MSLGVELEKRSLKSNFFLEKVDINTDQMTNYLIRFQELECLNKMPVFPSTLVVSEYVLHLHIGQDLDSHQKENANFLFLICEREYLGKAKKEKICYLSFMSYPESQKKKKTTNNKKNRQVYSTKSHFISIYMITRHREK